MKIIIMLALLSLVGCSGINTFSNKGDMTYSEIGDYFLDDQIQLENLKIVDEGNARVWNINIKNLMYYEMVLEIKMDFFTSDGIKIDNPWGWKPLTLESSQSDWLKFIAPNENIRNFKLYVKRAGS